MVKWLLLSMSLYCVMHSVLAADHYAVVGWHWYNEPIHHKKNTSLPPSIKAFDQLPPLQQLKLLQLVTRSLRAKAILSGNIQDITAYKKAQDFWVARATQFTVGWQRVLLRHPGLNYALKFSHENSLAPTMQSALHDKEHHVIQQLADSNGLLFFYRGKNKGDQFFAKILHHFTQQTHFALIPVSVDGVLSPFFKHSRQKQGRQKAISLGIHYFPALVLVNPTTHRHQVVSYGFKSEQELSERLLNIADGWQPEF